MKLKAPKGCGSVSFQGQEYPVVKGMVEVPDAATVLLEPGYGFIFIENSTQEPTAAEVGAP